MAEVYVSAVIDAPAAAVWGVVRDFNALPAWTPFVVESRIDVDVERGHRRKPPAKVASCMTWSGTRPSQTVATAPMTTGIHVHALALPT